MMVKRGGSGRHQTLFVLDRFCRGGQTTEISTCRVLDARCIPALRTTPESDQHLVNFRKPDGSGLWEKGRST